MPVCVHCCSQEPSGDGSTPSLLDARAASPSAVYNSIYTTTPFRGALAALPIDAALNAPLVDSSPFDITVRVDSAEACNSRAACSTMPVVQLQQWAAVGYTGWPTPHLSQPSHPHSALSFTRVQQRNRRW